MTVLITGGAQGIGAACVRLFAARGAKVAFVYEKSDAQASELAQQTGALPIRADVACCAEMFSAAALARQQNGPTGLLICCAGVAWSGLFQDMPEQALRRLMDVNALGSYFAAQSVAPDMIAAQRGAMIFVSSIWGLVGASCEAAYSMSKGAQIALTKALAQELGKSGIRVNCLAPGVIDTRMNAQLSPADLDALRDQTPLGRIGTPEEVAQAALYLSEAQFVTGQVLSPNGGLVV